MSKPADRKWGNLQGTMDRAFSAFGNSSILLGIGTFTLLFGILQIFGNTDNPRGIFYATILMTFLLVIFAEVLPKTYSINKPTRTAI